MNPITSPSSVAQQIASTEAAIEASNQRLRSLRQDLRGSTRHVLQASRKPLIFGSIALLALGVLMYPRRHAIAARVRLALRSPMLHTLLQRLPMIGMLAPLMAEGQHGEGVPPGAKKTALISALLPVLARLLPRPYPGQRTPPI